MTYPLAVSGHKEPLLTIPHGGTLIVEHSCVQFHIDYRQANRPYITMPCTLVLLWAPVA